MTHQRGHQEVKRDTDLNERISHYLVGQKEYILRGERNPSTPMVENTLDTVVFRLPASCRGHRGHGRFYN
jgi:hypothetical protein